MPIEPPTDDDRDRRAADLRQRAALVRANGWAPYESTWSSGEVLGVRVVLNEPGALAAAVEVWAPTLWGVEVAETESRCGYPRTHRWLRRLRVPEEMTEAEKASLAASRAAIGDLAHALVVGGDPESAEAALAAARQVNTKLDLDGVRDKLHVPDDAGEHEGGLRRIMLRIPDGWGRWISCSKGWYPIVIELDQALAAIDPSYEVHQCKEKFGGLRFYFGASEDVPEADRNRMRELVRAAEARCAEACEHCGEPGQRHVTGHGWLCTLCPQCAEASEHDFEPLGELVNDLTPDRLGLWRVTCHGDDPDSHWDMTHREVSIVDGERYRDFEVLALPSVLRTWRIRLADGTDVESGLIASIERVR